MIIKQGIALALAAALCSPAAVGQDQNVVFDAAVASQAAGKNAPSDVKGVPDDTAQFPMPVSPAKAFRSTPRTLNILVLVGNGAVNSIRSRSAATPVIEVRDERNLPVPGVAVVFQLPSVGPSGFFPGQNLTWTGRTDANGQVAASGLVPNQQAGRFGIQVTATHGSSVARATISQTNSFKSAPREASQATRRSVWWKVLAVTAAGGAAGGIVWATRGSAERPSVVLRPGTISFGGPR